MIYYVQIVLTATIIYCTQTQPLYGNKGLTNNEVKC